MSTFRKPENVRKRQALREALVAKHEGKIRVALEDMKFVRKFALAVLAEFPDWKQLVPPRVVCQPRLLAFFDAVCDHDRDLAGRMLDAEAMSFADYDAIRAVITDDVDLQYVNRWIYV